MKILIIKIGALGDVLRTSFVAQALKDKYPRSKIYWLTDVRAFPLLKNNPYIDRIIFTNEQEKLKEFFFNMVVNLEEDIDICKLASSLKSEVIIGFLFKDGKILPSPTAKEWFDMSALGEKPYNDILKKNNRKTHRQILGEMIGFNWTKYEPFLKLTPSQILFAEKFRQANNLKIGDLIVGINLGSADTWPKSLPINKSVILIERLYKRFESKNIKLLLFGGPNEIKRNQELLSKLKVPIIDTGCNNSLDEFISLVSVCSYFISTDSLALHVSLALKIKSISLIGPTSPYEIDMYNNGERVVAKSSCVCCYKKNCTSMSKIDINEVLRKFETLTQTKICLIITAFKEPNISRAIESTLNQKTKHYYEIIVSAPDKETISIVKKYSRAYKKIRLFKDPGKGKSLALNMLFREINADILILTDGDVTLSENSIEEIMNLFSNPRIGCVTGRPVPVEDKSSKYGYWANFLFDSAHRLRYQLYSSNSFLECSGYLFAFRKNKIDSIPLDVAEDAYIPYFFWEKGYFIGYAEKAKVFVKNPDNLEDWIKQKVRTSKAHETLHKYVNVKSTPRVKSFKNEIKGIYLLFLYPRKIKEIFWSLQLAIFRLFMWMRVFYDIKLKNNQYRDGWERIESTK